MSELQNEESPEISPRENGERPSNLQHWEELLVDVGLKNMDALQRAMVKDLLVRAWRSAIQEERRREREAAAAGKGETTITAETQEDGGTLYRFASHARNIMVPVDSGRGKIDLLTPTEEERKAYDKAMQEGRERFKAKESRAQTLDTVAKEKI